MADSPVSGCLVSGAVLLVLGGLPRDLAGVAGASSALFAAFSDSSSSSSDSVWGCFGGRPRPRFLDVASACTGRWATRGASAQDDRRLRRVRARAKRHGPKTRACADTLARAHRFCRGCRGSAVLSAGLARRRALEEKRLQLVEAHPAHFAVAVLHLPTLPPGQLRAPPWRAQAPVAGGR